MYDCIFCKIIKGEIPCHKVYEDEIFLAFLDINPVSSGHTLLIPKKHFRWVYDVDHFGQYWQVAQKIANALKSSSLNPDFVSFLTMGNDVHHAHIHIIPRKNNDQIGPILSQIPHLQLSDQDFKEITLNITNSLNNGK